MSGACAGEIQRAGGWKGGDPWASLPLYGLTIWSLQHGAYRQPDLLDGG